MDRGCRPPLTCSEHRPDPVRDRLHRRQCPQPQTAVFFSTSSPIHTGL